MVRQFLYVTAFPLFINSERGCRMNVYEALSLMIGFGILVATIMSK